MLSPEELDTLGLKLWLALCPHFTHEFARLKWDIMGTNERGIYIRAAVDTRADGAKEERKGCINSLKLLRSNTDEPDDAELIGRAIEEIIERGAHDMSINDNIDAGVDRGHHAPTPTANHYKIDEAEFTGAIVRLVALMKAEVGDGLGEVRITCHDGSTVRIVLKDKPPKASRKGRAKK